MFYIQKDRIFAVPIIHYTMELAAHVRQVFEEIQPDCIAVELAETMQLQLLHAASRLPDISVVVAQDGESNPIYYLSEPCDAAFEGLRSALDAQIPTYCIDLDVDYYPDVKEYLPDPYSIQRIGLKAYYEIYKKSAKKQASTSIDEQRELHMARRLKELSLSYDRILFIGGMAHVENVLKLIDRQSFPFTQHANRDSVQLYTLTEKSTQEVMAEYGWITTHYEIARSQSLDYPFPPDRQKLIYQMYKEAGRKYVQATGNAFPGYNLRNIMKFARNCALLSNQLMPQLYQVLTAAKGCVDHNYAYEAWLLAVTYPYRKNIDGLPELELSIEEVWGHSKLIRFHLKEQSRKNNFLHRQRKDKANFRFKPPGMFSICSYPPEDLVIERFGEFLKKKGTQLATEEAARTIPFSTSIEDGVDTRETIRHWHEKKLYVKVKGKPAGGVGSVVMVFDEDSSDDQAKSERYPWRTTWLGEHEQESDMAFFATSPTKNVVGPGISRCEYGAFMMSSPPRRMYDIWCDPDYDTCQTKAEVLLMAAIDYAVKPLVVYVAAKPPRAALKTFAKRFGKKVVYIPIGQLSPITLNKLRVFHVLDGHDRREIAEDYLF